MRKMFISNGKMIKMAVSAIAIIAISSFAFSAPKQTLTDADIKILKTGDHDAVSEVLYKIMSIYDSDGKAALKPAVPALIDCAWKELRLPEDQRWNLIDIVKVISLTGDERVKPLLLHLMSAMYGGGNPATAQGFLSLGTTVLPAVVDSLKSTTAETRGRAAITLHKMAQLDTSGKFFTSKDKALVKDRLVANLKDTNASVRVYTVVALRSFGDTSTIPALENIEKYDAHKDSGGTYEVRIEAKETLKALRGKK